MKYWIATDKKEVFHWGTFDEEKQEFTTTQPFVMWFENEGEWQAEMDLLGIQWKEEEEKEEPSLENYLLQEPPIGGDE